MNDAAILFFFGYAAGMVTVLVPVCCVLYLSGDKK